tara:strand:+ start:172 stop:999 length:828 start_codon:yes stop_codon:yes gene_type:complete
MPKRNTKKKTKRNGKNISEKLNKKDDFVIYSEYYLRPKGKKNSKKTKKTKKTVKIIDIPFSKYKSKGTRATLGNIRFNYQEYRNILLFFHFMDKKIINNINYNNPILTLVSDGQRIYTEYIPEFNLGKKFSIIIVNLKTEEGNHANIILVNNNNNTIEYYEPHGYRRNKQSEIAGNKGIYNKKVKVLKGIFSILLPSHSFIDVVSMNKKTSFQTELDPDEHSGFCVIWCILFIHYRLLNPDILLSKLIKHINKIMSTTKLLKYAKHVEDTVKQKI